MKRKKEGDAIWLLLTFDKEIKLNIDQIKKPLEVHCNGFQYIHIQRLFYFQLQQKLQYAGIVGKIKIYDNTNRDFMVIGLFI